MRKKEILAMLLAGGQGSRLGVLTATKAKPAVTFGGKYRIIDFTLSNCVNSGIDTVGVLTQYQPLLLNQHIGIGIPWDLDRRSGGVTVLSPHVKGDSGEWYMGTANALFHNIDYIDNVDPEYIVVLSGDHIYKMDYSNMLSFHKDKKADATIAVLEVPMLEASRFGIMNCHDDSRIYEFEEKPPEPKSNLASMGIYIFTWEILREMLIKDSGVHRDSDFGKHIIPLMIAQSRSLYAYRFCGYWRDVGTIESYWSANMDLVQAVPEFNMYENFWQIYTDSFNQPPIYTGPGAETRTSLLADGCEVYGTVINSVLGTDVYVGEGTIIRDSIVMSNTFIGQNCEINRCVIDEHVSIGDHVKMGTGENVPNESKPRVYDCGITVVGTNSKIPSHVNIGKNCEIYGNTVHDNYNDDNCLPSGKSINLESEATI
ncbi:MAG: glucose-1-phosphate adenylyltransferase [Defluviitaleaceae bacterium]|nr:glucose-1-phosphate adenylyltransferase [Defluviitaleaceae bacterium]